MGKQESKQAAYKRLLPHSLLASPVENNEFDFGRLSFGPAFDLHLHGGRLAADLQFSIFIGLDTVAKEGRQDIGQAQVAFNLIPYNYTAISDMGGRGSRQHLLLCIEGMGQREQDLKKVERESFQPVADLVSKAIAFDASAAERKPAGPKKLPQMYRETAAAVIAQGNQPKLLALFKRDLGKVVVLTGDAAKDTEILGWAIKEHIAWRDKDDLAKNYLKK